MLVQETRVSRMRECKRALANLKRKMIKVNLCLSRFYENCQANCDLKWSKLSETSFSVIRPVVALRMTRYLVFVVLIAVAQAADYAGKPWNWRPNSYVGPTHWHLLYQKCDTRYNWRESPVDLVDDRQYYDDNIHLHYDRSYDESYKVMLKNYKDKTVTFEFDEKKLITVRASVFGEMTTYRLHSGHFHWGLLRNGGKGAEHLINGERHTGELHLVHYKTSFNSFGDALAAGNDSLLVIGVFIEMSWEDSPDAQEMKHILNHFPRVVDADSNITMYIRPHDLIPADHDLYNYEGGLTTPECDGVVQWYVYRKPAQISKELLDVAFWSYETTPQGLDRKPLGDNYRPTVELGARMIGVNFRREVGPEPPVQAAPRTGLAVLALLAGLLVARLL